MSSKGERCLQKTGKWAGYNFIGWLKKTGKLVKDAFTGRCQKQVKDAILSVKDWKRLVQNYRRKWTQHRRYFTSDQRRHESEVANRSWPVRCFRLLSRNIYINAARCFHSNIIQKGLIRPYKALQGTSEHRKLESFAMMM